MPNTTLGELVVLRNLIDSMLADKPALSVECSLYASRIHIMNAIRYQAVNFPVNKEVA